MGTSTLDGNLEGGTTAYLYFLGTYPMCLIQVLYKSAQWTPVAGA